jgi:hypothetical protein
LPDSFPICDCAAAIPPKPMANEIVAIAAVANNVFFITFSSVSSLFSELRAFACPKEQLFARSFVALPYVLGHVLFANAAETLAFRSDREVVFCSRDFGVDGWEPAERNASLVHLWNGALGELQRVTPLEKSRTAMELSIAWTIATP